MVKIENENNSFGITFNKAKILVVDDIEMNVMLIEGFLRDTGLEIFSARNGKAAVEIINSLKPDIVLMDIRMPIMDGVKATEIIKQNTDTSSIPIIALTATSIETEGINDDLFDGFLTKPLTMSSLTRVISKFIKKKEIK